jgi:hypothetical protein
MYFLLKTFITSPTTNVVIVNFFIINVPEKQPYGSLQGQSSILLKKTQKEGANVRKVVKNTKPQF